MLSTVHSAGPILCTPHFIVNLILTIVLTFGINFGIMWGIADRWPSKRVIFDINTFGNILGTHLVLAVLAFFSTTSAVCDRIRRGLAHPIFRSSLQGNCLKRVLFFSLAVNRRRIRCVAFVGNSLLLCTIPVTIGLAFACWASLDFPAITTKEICNTISLAQFCAIDATWKTISAVVMLLLNYLAAHNDAQPELYDDTVDAANEGEMSGDEERGDLSPTSQVVIQTPPERPLRIIASSPSEDVGA